MNDKFLIVIDIHSIANFVVPTANGFTVSHSKPPAMHNGDKMKAVQWAMTYYPSNNIQIRKVS